MVEDEQILNSLQRILEKSLNYKDVDAAVDLIANKGKRLSLIDGIHSVEASLDEKWSKTLNIHVIQDTTLVWSHKDPSGKVTLTFETDLSIIRDLNNPEIEVETDTVYDRYLYYDEFKTRLHVLKICILQSRLDDYLAIKPDNMIHMIMGLSGELLRLIEINPVIGKTNRRFIQERGLAESIIKSTGIGTLAAVLQKSIENYRANLKPGDVAISVLPRDNKNDDIAEGMPIQPVSENQSGKTPIIKKAKIVRIYKASKLEEKGSKKDL